VISLEPLTKLLRRTKKLRFHLVGSLLQHRGLDTVSTA
jgi:hypothetical protein